MHFESITFFGFSTFSGLAGCRINALSGLCLWLITEAAAGFGFSTAGSSLSTLVKLRSGGGSETKGEFSLSGFLLDSDRWTGASSEFASDATAALGGPPAAAPESERVCIKTTPATAHTN